MGIVDRVILPAAGEDGDLVIGDQCGGHIILCREGVASTEDQVGTPRLQRARQARGLRGDVPTSTDADARKWALSRETRELLAMTAIGIPSGRSRSIVAESPFSA